MAIPLHAIFILIFLAPSDRFHANNILSSFRADLIIMPPLSRPSIPPRTVFIACVLRFHALLMPYFYNLPRMPAPFSLRPHFAPSVEVFRGHLKVSARGLLPRPVLIAYSSCARFLLIT